jgi:hypothetical protein
VTAPKVNTIKRGDSRFYVHPEQGDGRIVPGVTSVVGMLPKPFLTRWAAKSVAEYATDNLGAVVGLAMADRAGTVDLLKGAPWRDTRQAADTGTAVHNLFERLADGENVGRVHPDLKPYADHFADFLQEFQPTFLFQEETVWSDEHLYAGSFDALAEVQGERVWIDYKTTRSGVHEEVALQLSAYAHADFILRPDGSKVPLPKATAGAVVHVRPEGWSLTPVRVDDAVFEHFLHLRKTFDWVQEVSKTVLGAPMNANPSTTTKGRIRAANQRAAKAAAAR